MAELADDARIWRYMSFAKFLWMIERRQLWFPRIDCLGDPWEQNVSPERLTRLAAKQSAAYPADYGDHDTALKTIRTFIRDWRRSTFVSCWSEDPDESHALWQIYCGSDEGVAIQTTVGRLKQAFADFGDKMTFHRVNYSEPEPGIVGVRLTELATQKRPMFKFEQEIRVVLKTWTPSGRRPKKGHGLLWDSEETVERVLIHPDAERWFVDAVESAVARFAPALRDHIKWSAMRERPAVR